MHSIEITAQAQANADAAYAWMMKNISPAYAEQWYQELFRQIETLTQNPSRCARAPESDKFTEEIRELIYGKRRSRNKYRIIFTIRKNTVVILYIHHSARDEISP